MTIVSHNGINSRNVLFLLGANVTVWSDRNNTLQIVEGANISFMLARQLTESTIRAFAHSNTNWAPSTSLPLQVKLTWYS